MHDTSSSSSMQHHVNNSPRTNNVQPRSQQDFGDKTLITAALDYRNKTSPHFVNQYAVLGRIGKGQHGEVFKGLLAPEYTFCVAIKACKRNNPRETKMSQLRQNNHALPRSKNGKSNLADKVENAERKIKREIAIMKKCHHGQIVRLYEVIDDRFFSKILMVMEFMGGGEVKWRDTNNKPVLRVDQCRRICRDVLLGLEYLHYQGIIHRDIKPANLLWTEDRQSVKITDFGVAHFSYAQRLSTQQNEDDPEEKILLDESTLTRTAGTPTFLAPEVVYGIGDAVGEDDGDNSNDNNCEDDEEQNENGASKDASGSEAAAASTRSPPISSPTSGTSLSTNDHSDRPLITKAIDVWALGVTLYCLLFGTPPWQASNEYQLYGKLRLFDFEVPSTMGSDCIETGGRHHDLGDKSEGGVVVNLLAKLLEKDYNRRITLDEVKRLPWILRDIPSPENWLQETSPSRHDVVSVSADETSVAMSQVKFRYPGFADRLIRIFRPKKRQNNTEVMKYSERLSTGAATTRRSKSVNAGRDSGNNSGSVKKRDSLQGKVLIKGKEKEKTARLQQERSGLSWATYANNAGKVVPLDVVGCLHGRLSRKNSILQPQSQSQTQSQLQRQASQQSQADKSLKDNSRHHSGGSFYRNLIPKWKGSVGRFSNSSSGGGSAQVVATAAAGQNHVRSRYSEEQIINYNHNQNGKDNNCEEMEASMSIAHAIVPRSSSWEPSTDYEGKKEIDILGSENGSEDGYGYGTTFGLGEEQMMLGAGGILSRVGSRSSANVNAFVGAGADAGANTNSVSSPSSGFSGRQQLSVHTSQSDRMMMMRATTTADADSPVVVDPVDRGRTTFSNTHAHTISPLALNQDVMAELEQVSIFDSDDYDYDEDEYYGNENYRNGDRDGDRDRVYGLGSQTLIEDDSSGISELIEDDTDDDDDDEPQHIEIRRRRPSESMTRSSLHRPSEEHNGNGNDHARPMGNVNIVQEV